MKELSLVEALNILSPLCQKKYEWFYECLIGLKVWAMIPRIDRTIAYVPMAAGSDPPQQTLSHQEQDDEWELYESWED